LEGSGARGEDLKKKEVFGEENIWRKEWEREKDRGLMMFLISRRGDQNCLKLYS
jgi:hypothetical protein